MLQHFERSQTSLSQGFSKKKPQFATRIITLDLSVLPSVVLSLSEIFTKLVHNKRICGMKNVFLIVFTCAMLC